MSQSGNDGESLKITLPLSLYCCTPNYNLLKLHECLKLQPLDENWHDVSVGDKEIAYCSIVHNKFPYINFTPKICDDFTWSVYFQSKQLDTTNFPAIAVIQHELKTPRDVLNLMETI